MTTVPPPDPRPRTAASAPAGSEMAAVERLKLVREAMLAEIRKVIVGQSDVMESLLLALFSRGH